MSTTSVPGRDAGEGQVHHGFAEALASHPTTVISPGAMALSVVVAVWVEKLGQQVELKRTTAGPKPARLPRRARP